MFGDIKDPLKVLNQAKTTKFSPKQVKHNTFSTAVESKPTDIQNCESKCPCCSKCNHVLDNCHFFLNKPFSEREKFINMKKLWFGCLISTTHHSTECEETIICKKYKKVHPTSFHKYVIIEGMRDDTSSVHNDKATGRGTAAAMNVIIKDTFEY